MAVLLRMAGHQALMSCMTKSFSNGDRIRHAKFGEGTVIEVTGSGNAMIVTLDFDTVGTKKFTAAYAPVEKINK